MEVGASDGLANASNVGMESFQDMCSTFLYNIFIFRFTNIV